MATKKTEKVLGDDVQNVLIPLPKKLHRELKFLSVDRDRTLNALIIEAIEEWWKRQSEFGKYPPLDRGKKKKPAGR